MKVAEVIKYEGNNDVFIYKHPIEDFTYGTQLIVHESQEAIFFRNGQALDLFGPGRYTLETENIPLLSKSLTSLTDGKTPYHCEVYFINKVNAMDVLWGTRSHMPVEDVKYKVILPIGANGQFGIKVIDSRKCLLKLVGTINEFNKATLKKYFRGLILTRIKDYLTTQMIEHNISILEIHTHLVEISEAIEGELKDKFLEYGLSLFNFCINTVIVAQNDPSFKKLKDALAKRAEMELLGYNYKEERTFDMLNKAAENEGAASSVMGTGLGLGMGVNIGSTVGGALGNALNNNTSNDNRIQQKDTSSISCPKCNAKLPKGAKFCNECGSKIVIDPNIMICPKCNKETFKGKFCSNCGFKLIRVCNKCGKELAPHAKFCNECGEKVNE